MLRTYDLWLPLREVRLVSGRRIEARMRLDPSSEWFSGHFEGVPIMPAVSMLSLVGETVRRQGKEEGRELEVSGFYKVRIKRVVSPGEELRVSVATMPPDSQADLHFEVTSRGSTVAKGILRITENLV
jgi:3-hydroxymyristoyl/3-hydroxydecanoyl-(acyl carrier protein) dehydratase